MYHRVQEGRHISELLKYKRFSKLYIKGVLTKVITQFFANEALNVVFINNRPPLALLLLAGNYKSCSDFPVAFVWNPNNRDICDSRMRKKTVFDFERVDVLSTSDDYVFDTARYGDITI